MSLIGLVHLAEGVFKQTQQNQEGAAANGKAQAQSAGQKTDAIDRDEFRHSNNTNTGSEAGLFQVRQASVFSAAATVLLVQGTEGQNQNAQAGQKQAEQPTNNDQVNSANANANTAANTAATSSAATNTTNNDDAQALSQLASLNAALIALGLSQDEINVVDRVAQLINNFSPAAFTSLVNQLQVLAQENGQSTANTAGNTSATPNTNTPANTIGTDANGATATAQNSGFTIQSLTIRFAGVKEIVQPNGRGSSADNATELISAFSLQVSEAQIVLGNPATGQAAQIQVPQTTTPTTSTVNGAAKAATA